MTGGSSQLAGHATRFQLLGVNGLLKRALDIVLSLGLILASLPLMVIVALCIPLDGGPAVYRHTRLGRDRRPFGCLKFRTMVMNGDEVLRRHLEANPEAAEEWAQTQKLKDDPRVTRIGRFLRATSLDELPQFFNVLRGDMTLVGPRPVTESELARYGVHAADYLRVRPGITGLWQVSGRSTLSYEERVRLDVEYVRNWSLFQDIKIIFMTAYVVFGRHGAV
ncbi:sugar transferase [Azospirillum sp. sgz302134]